MRIALSRAQVQEVLNARGARPQQDLLLSKVSRSGSVLAATAAALLAPPGVDRALSRSLLLGLVVLAHFPPDRGECGVTELARDLGLQVGTAHRYVSTLVTAGLLEQDPSTRRYRLASCDRSGRHPGGTAGETCRD